MKINPIRKILRSLGFDFHRHRHVPDKLEWFKRLNIKTVLDIGANVGQFAQEARLLFPEAKIYSFEPISECFKELTETFKEDSNFEVFNFGLGEKEAELMIHKSNYRPGSSIREMEKDAEILFPHIKEHTEEKIKIKRLDDLNLKGRLLGNILVKIDTEGYEKNVIEGGKEMIAEAKVVLVENSFIARFKGQSLFAEIYQALVDLGFSYKGAWSEKLNPQTGEILFEDSIFLKD